MNENFNYVAKQVNPPNVPQARPIEKFWSYLKQKVYEGGWLVKTEKQLTDCIESKLKYIDLNYLQSLMSGIKIKLRAIADKDVFS